MLQATLLEICERLIGLTPALLIKFPCELFWNVIVPMQHNLHWPKHCQKATDGNQVLQAETFTATVTLHRRLSKVDKILSRNASPTASVRWHGSLDNTWCASHVIRIHRKTLRATQSANLNLEMTEILYQLEEIDLFGIPGLQLKSTWIWKLRNYLPWIFLRTIYLPKMQLLSDSDCKNDL